MTPSTAGSRAYAAALEAHLASSGPVLAGAWERFCGDFEMVVRAGVAPGVDALVPDSLHRRLNSPRKRSASSPVADVSRCFSATRANSGSSWRRRVVFLGVGGGESEGERLGVAAGSKCVGAVDVLRKRDRDRVVRHRVAVAE